MTFSPLRYPGGKASLVSFIAEVIDINNLSGGVYIEPFAGGAGAALELLFLGKINKLILNDKDELISAFWNAILKRTDDFLILLEKTEISIKEYYKQREKLTDGRSRRSELQLGFATFYVNRCNRSGILKKGTGPIGGKTQKSEWNIDARFNKEALAKRIRLIGDFQSKITIHNKDAVPFLKMVLARQDIRPANIFIYLDPPYYRQGKSLYRHYYTDDDHRALADFLRIQQKYKWLVSYDECKFIEDLYQSEGCKPVHLQYTANNYKVGRELVIPSDTCLLPGKLVSCRKIVGFAEASERISLVPAFA